MPTPGMTAGLLLPLAACTVPLPPAPVDSGPNTTDSPATTDSSASPTTDPEDADGDGFPGQADCDDGDAAVHPGADEVPGDGVDQDCDCQDRGTLRATDADLVWQGDVPYDHAGWWLLDVVYAGGRAIGLLMGADQVPGGKDAGFGRAAYWSPGAAVAILDGSAPKEGPFTEAMGVEGGSGALGPDGETLLVVGRGVSDGPDDSGSNPQNRNGNIDFYRIPDPGSVVPLEGVYARLTGPYGAQCGSSVAVGDWNGDGVADVLFSCLGTDARGLYALSGPITSGPHTLDETAWWIPETAQTTEEAFTHLDVLSLPRDPAIAVLRTTILGVPTLLFASPENVAAMVPVAELPDRVISPDGGSPVARRGGDPDHDGASEMLLANHVASERAGTLGVLHGPVVGAVDIRSVLPTYTGTCAYDWFGNASVVGDFDGDGADDLAVGAPADVYFSAPRVGKVFVFDGPGWDTTARPPADADRVLAGDLAWDGFGANLAVADIDNDGYDDLFVAAPLDSRDVWEAGRVYLFHGGPEGLAHR